MKSLLAALTGLLLLGCGSGGKAKILEPEIQLVQITGPAESMYPSGRFEVQYGMRIGNRSGETITLRRVQLETIGAGGPYLVPRDQYYVTRAIDPTKFEDVTFWVHAIATGTRFSIDAQAPVTIRGTAYFDAPAGAFRKVFVVNLSQVDRGRSEE
jgi:hypothetical protein